MVGKGVAMVALPLEFQSTMTYCFYNGGPGLFSSLPSFQAVTSAVFWTAERTPTAVLSLGLLFKPHFPAPKLPPYQEIHDSGWGMPDCGMKHNSYTVLPSTD